MTDSRSWEMAVDYLLARTPVVLRGDIERICVSGTSSTALIYDLDLNCVSRPPRMYNFNVLQEANIAKYGQTAMIEIQKVCPAGSSANAPTSTCAKLLTWHLENPLLSSERLVHQADYMIHYLTSESVNTSNPTSNPTTNTTPTAITTLSTTTAPTANIAKDTASPEMIDMSRTNTGNTDIQNKTTTIFTSDWHNALKLGYDVHILTYPKWLTNLLREQGINLDILPCVVEPGRPVACISSKWRDMGYSDACTVVAGTTDSIAAFLASNASTPGQAVTSLGSTLVIKLLSTHPVEDSSRGIYSHRLGDKWLVGGASNVGCAVLREEGFSDKELQELSVGIEPLKNSPLKYYPLMKMGERFPVNDPFKQPVLTPKPYLVKGASGSSSTSTSIDTNSSGDSSQGHGNSDSDSSTSSTSTNCTGNEQGEGRICREQYLHGILEGIAAVERDGYAALQELGGTPVTEVFTAGGGARNEMWTSMRQRMLGVKTRRASNVDAAYGDAQLSKKYYTAD